MCNKATRHNEGKPRYSLIDYPSLEPLVRVLEFGAEKYGEDNWKKGLEPKSILDSLLRHCYAYLSGETHDEESKLPHVGHILCNAMFLSYFTKYDCDAISSAIRHYGEGDVRTDAIGRIISDSKDSQPNPESVRPISDYYTSNINSNIFKGIL